MKPWVAVVIVLLLSLLVPVARAAVVTFPSSQTVTTGTSSGTFPDCAQQTADSLTCIYTEGDDGTGATITPMLLPNALGTGNSWTAVGCAEADEWQCVDDGPSHDSDVTHVSAAVSITAIVSEYEMQDCTGQAWCLSSSTVTDVTVWAYTRFVPGPNTDPLHYLNAFQLGISCPGAAIPLLPTPTYANGSNSDDALCSWVPPATLDNLRVRITAGCVLVPCDQERATAIGATITITQPNYRDTVLYEFAGIALGRAAVLDFRAAASAGESYSFQVYDWSGATWNTRDTVSGATLTDYAYELTADEVASDGTVRVRWADGTQSGDTTQGTLTVDYAAITQGDAPTTGGGGNPVNAACTYNWLLQVADCRDTSSWPAGAEVVQVCMALDGGEARCAAGKYGTVHLPSGDSFFSIALTQHRLRVDAYYSNGAVATRDLAVQLDNFPRILIFALIVFAVIAIGYGIYRRRHRPRPVDPWGGGG